MDLACIACRSALPPGATFCTSCGRSTTANAGPMLCGHCGIVAPRRCTTCVRCSRPFTTVAKPWPADREDRFWCAVRCTFQCRSCAYDSPLDHLDLDGNVSC